MNRPRNWPVRRTRSEPQSVLTQLPHAVRTFSSKTRTGSRAGRARHVAFSSLSAVSALRIVQRRTCGWPLTYPTSFRNAGLPGDIGAGMETLISASGPAFFAPPASCTLFAIAQWPPPRGVLVRTKFGCQRTEY